MARTKDQRLKDYRRQVAADVKSVLSTEPGRRFLWHVLTNVAGIHSDTFVPGGEDGARTSAVLQGKQRVGHELQALAQKEARAEYVTMVREAMDALNLRGVEDAENPSEG